MPYTRRVLQRAKARLEEDKRKKQNEYQAHLEQAYAMRPRLREIDRALQSTAANAIALCLGKGEDPRPAIEKLKQENLALQNERQWILDEAEFGDDFLDDSPVCSVCGGTGYVGSEMCECLHELCRQEQKRELSALLGTGKERFEHFRLDFYPDRYDPGVRTTARAMMQINLNKCKRYAAGFRPGADSLLFSGATGLGKTFLSACIARQVTDLGYSVVYVSASKLFADYEAVKFERMDASEVEDYENCDLLILDDLGTEMTTQFVISALYEIVNTRLLQHRATLISTNLGAEELEARYRGPIASRLLGSYELVYFVGDDIRKKLR